MATFGDLTSSFSPSEPRLSSAVPAPVEVAGAFPLLLDFFFLAEISGAVMSVVVPSGGGKEEEEEEEEARGASAEIWGAFLFLGVGNFSAGMGAGIEMEAKEEDGRDREGVWAGTRVHCVRAVLRMERIWLAPARRAGSCPGVEGMWSRRC